MTIFVLITLSAKINKNIMLSLNHKKLEVWKFSIKLIKEIYIFTECFPKYEMYGLSNQLRRASISIASNIAEGSSRKSNLERRRFFEIARSSLVELDTQLEISFVLNYLKVEEISKFESDFIRLFKMLSSLINKT